MAAEAKQNAPHPPLCGDAVETDAQGRAVLIGGRCADCGARAFPAPPVCAGCMGETILREALPRRGTLYAFSVVHVAPKKWKLPMCVGYVDLPDGVRVFTHLQGEDLSIGDTVEPIIGTVGQDETGVIESFMFKRVTA